MFFLRVDKGFLEYLDTIKSGIGSFCKVCTVHKKTPEARSREHQERVSRVSGGHKKALEAYSREHQERVLSAHKKKLP